MSIRAFDLKKLGTFLVGKRLIRGELFFKEKFFHKLGHRNTAPLHHYIQFESLIGIKLVQFVHIEKVILALQDHSSLVLTGWDIKSVGSRINIEGGIELLLESSLSKFYSQVCFERKPLGKVYRQLNRMYLNLIDRAIHR